MARINTDRYQNKYTGILRMVNIVEIKPYLTLSKSFCERIVLDLYICH